MVRLRVLQAYTTLGKHGFQSEAHLKTLMDAIYKTLQDPCLPVKV